MTEFIRNILTEAKFWDDRTQELIDAMVYGIDDKEKDYELYGYPADWLTSPVDKLVSDKASLEKLTSALKKLAEDYAGDSIDISVDKERFSLLKEAVKCPIVRKQFVIIDLGYSKAKVTTACLYKAIKDEIQKRAVFRSEDGDGLFVKIKKQLLHDNEVSNEEIGENQ